MKYNLFKCKKYKNDLPDSAEFIIPFVDFPLNTG